MEKTIALFGLILFGLHLIARIRFFIENRGQKILFIRNTIDIFITMGILVLSLIQFRGLGDEGVTRNYTWYILGLLAVYVLWVRSNVQHYRKRSNTNTNNKKTSKSNKKK